MKTTPFQVKKQYLPPRTAFGRTRSVDKSNKAEAILHESQSPSFQNSDLAMYRELTIIERKLDKSEISFRKQFPQDVSSIELEAQFYFDYLNSISNLAKRKDPRLGVALLRGTIALDKLFEKLFNFNIKQLALASAKARPKLTDCAIQTLEEAKQIKPLKESLPELENLKQLSEKLKQIKVSRVVNQLLDLYESLSNMQTDIPEPTLMPDQNIEDTNPEAIMSMHLNVIKNHVFHIINGSKPDISQGTLDKSCQVELILQNIPEVRVLEKTVYEKDQELVKVKQKAETSSIQNKILEDKFKRMERFYEEIEKKQNQTEFESIQLKGKFQHSEIVIVAQEKRIKWFDGKLLKKTEKLVRAKLRIDELKKIIVNKQQKMNKLQDELYETKISWKICEEKLFDLEKAWEHKTGRQFQHKEVDLKLIIAKHSIIKEDLIDQKEHLIIDDEESSVSDNIPPDVEEFKELINKKTFEFKPNNNQSSPESPSSPAMPNQTNKKIQQKSLFENVFNELQAKPPDSDSDPDSDESSELEAQDQGFKVPVNKKKTQPRPSNTKPSDPTAGLYNSNEINEDWEVAAEDPESILNPFLKQNPKKSLPVQTSISPHRFSQNILHPGNKPSKSFFQSNPSESPNKSYTIQQTTTKLSSSFESSEFRSVSTSNSKVQELIKLEKKLTIEFNNKEKEFISSLINSQPDLFGQYKNLKDQLEKIRKELNIYVLSTGIQCNLISSTLEIRKTSNPSVLNTLSDFANSARNPLEEIKDEDEVELLNKVFDNEKVLQSISLKDKIQIVKSLKGHKRQQCREMCPHLLRVLKIKWRCRGILYPVRNILMKSLDT